MINALTEKISIKIKPYLSEKSFHTSVAIHFILFLLILFYPAKQQIIFEKIKSKTNSGVIVLDSIMISDSNNLKLKNTKESSTGSSSQKKEFATATIKGEDQLNQINSPKPSKDQYKAEEIIHQIKKEDESHVIRSIKRKPTREAIKDDDEMASLLKSLDRKKTGGSINPNGDKTGQIGKGEFSYDSRFDSTVDLATYIRSYFMEYWNVPIGGVDLEDLTALVRLKLDIEGNVTKIDIKIEGKKNKTNNYEQVFIDSVVRAIHMGIPIELPKDKYSEWSELELIFNAGDML